MDSICRIDLANTDITTFARSFADCIVLTKDHKILLQQRTADWGPSAGYLTAFGGHIEPNETPLQAMIRELSEELGAEILPEDVIDLGAVTEEETGHAEIVYLHFWHDRHDTITGCYECEAAYYDRAAGAEAHPKIMNYLRWALHECQSRRLVE